MLLMGVLTVTTSALAMSIAGAASKANALAFIPMFRLSCSSSGVIGLGVDTLAASFLAFSRDSSANLRLAITSLDVGSILNSTGCRLLLS